MKALIFDIDGVLVDVSKSYRIAIKKTVEFFSGKEVSLERIQEYKNKGGLNNDWDCSEAILKDRDVVVEKQKIIDKFNEYYLGKNKDDPDALIKKEAWLLDISLLEQLTPIYAVGIMTGRPQIDADLALQVSNTGKYFGTVIVLEDVEKGKPDPEGLLLCLEKMGCNEGWYFGDTPDDMRAAKAAGLVAVGVFPPQDKSELLRSLLVDAGADYVIGSINEIQEVLQ
jgi:HAD superfamily hydrolase (TIGR01548 family)